MVLGFGVQGSWALAMMESQPTVVFSSGPQDRSDWGMTYFIMSYIYTHVENIWYCVIAYENVIIKYTISSHTLLHCAIPRSYSYHD